MYMLFAAIITIMFGIYVYETERRIVALKDELERKIDDQRAGFTDIVSSIQSRQSVLAENVTEITQQYKQIHDTITNINKDTTGLSILNKSFEDVKQQLIKAKDDSTNINKEISRLATVGKSVDEVRQQCKRMEDTIVNLNKHISFSARLGKIIADIATDATIVFDSVIINYGNGYNAASGIFKAPITGIYFFTSSILTMHPSTVEINLMVNGGSQMWMYACARNIGLNNAVNSLIIKLQVGDEVKIVKNKFGAVHFTYITLGVHFLGFYYRRMFDKTMLLIYNEAIVVHLFKSLSSKFPCLP